ncbi:MAG: ATP-binding protein [Bacteroidota bacterium]
MIFRFIVCAFLGGITSLLAQSPYAELAGPIEIDHYDYLDFNGSHQNWKVRQGPQGIIYVANNNGVVEFDGKRWRMIDMPSPKSGRSIDLDEAGHVFVGGVQEMGVLLPNERGELAYVSLVPLLPDSISFTGTIWNTIRLKDHIFFCEQQHIFQFDPAALILENGGIDSMYRPIIHLPDTSIFATFFSWNDQFFTFQKFTGIKVLKDDSLHLYFEDPIFTNDEDRIMGLLPMGDPEQPDPDKALMYTFGGKFYILEDKKIRRFPMNPEVEAYVGGGVYTDAKQLRDGSYFFSNTQNKGILIVDQQGRLKYAFKDGFPSDAVYSILQDRENNLWAGLSNGLARVAFPSPVGLMAAHFDMEVYVTRISRFQKKLIVASTIGLFELRPAEEVGEHAYFERIVEEVKTAWDIEIRDEKMLISSSEGIYEYIDGKANQLTNLRGYAMHTNPFHPDIVFASLSEGGIAVLKYQNGHWTFMGLLPYLMGLANSFQQESKEVFYMNNFQGEAYHIRSSNFDDILRTENLDSLRARIQRIEMEIDTIRMPDKMAKEELFIPRLLGKLHFGTFQGLRTYDPESNQLIPDSTFGPLFADTTRDMYGLYEGPEQELWFYSVKDGRGKLFIGNQDSVGTYQWNDQVMLAISGFTNITHIYFDSEDQDIVWLGTNKGIYRYDKGEQATPMVDYQAHVRKVIANADSVIFGGHEVSSKTQAIDFSLNSLRFEYAATSYKDHFQLIFRVKLEGYDEDWLPWTKEIHKDYTRIPPGAYTFMVEAQNADLITSKIDSFSFEILPPWYLTWWAYFLYVVAAIVLIALIVVAYSRWKVRRLQARNQELEGIVEERTQEVIRVQEQLMVQDKMAALGQMTAGIAHEIKNPLNFVNNFAKNIKELAAEIFDEIQEVEDAFQPESYEDLKEMLSMMQHGSQSIETNGIRANEIVSSMMLHMGSSSGVRSSIDLNQLLSEHVHLAYHGFMAQGKEVDIEIEEHLDSSLPPVSVQAPELSRAFLNLVHNALEAVSEKLGEPGFVPHISISSQAEEASVVIRIKDNGPGIPADIHPKLFEPFFTTKPTGQGNIGLGLSIVYDIIVMGHQGEISANSKEGKGTEFLIRLPLGTGT